MKQFKKDSLGDRMKNYEYQSRYYLETQKPVIIRLDGKAFHTFTHGFQKPFDSVFSNAMSATMLYLCENIQNCVFGYTQSDEITLVLIDDFNPNASAWFDNNIQKIASVAASMATLEFNRAFNKFINEYNFSWQASLIPQSCEEQEEHMVYVRTLKNANSRGGVFDARAFNIPKDEIINCLIWRQLDAVRNSIQACGQAAFSHKELLGKSNKEVLEMLAADPKKEYLRWENQPISFKYGSCAIKDNKVENNGIYRTKWRIDYNTPIFTEDRDYVNKWLYSELG